MNFKRIGQDWAKEEPNMQDMLTLEWKGHSQTLTSRLWTFFQEECLVDTHLTFHGRQIRAHRLILEAFIPFWRESLRMAKQDDDDDEFFVGVQEEDMQPPFAFGHPDDVNYLMEFLYTGRITDVPRGHLQCLMAIAEHIGLQPLITIIKDQEKHKSVVKEIPRCCAQVEEWGGNNVTRTVDANGVEEEEEPEEGEDEMLAIQLSPEIIMDGEEEDCPKHKQSVEVSPLETEVQLSSNTSRYSLRTCNKRNSVIQHAVNESRSLPSRKKFVCGRQQGAVKRPPKKVSTERGVGRRTNIPKIKHKKKTLPTEDDDEPEEMDSKEKLHVCKYCDHRTSWRSRLKQHLAIRHKVDVKGNRLPDMKCSQCDFVCVTNYQMNKHTQRKHTLDKPYKCTQCSYTAVFSADFKKHVRVRHQHIRDYMCDVCGYMSKTRNCLNNHMRTIHEGIKPFKCEFCGVQFAHSASYKRHRQKHMGNAVNAYICHVCAHSCPRRSQLRLHMQKKHMIELEPAWPLYKDITPDASIT